MLQFPGQRLCYLKKKILVTKFTTETVKMAKETRPRFDIKKVELHEAVSITTMWCQKLIQTATTERIVSVNNSTDWFTPELKAMQTELFLSKDDKKLQNIYVRELDKAKRAFESKMKSKNSKKGVWSIINRKESNQEQITLSKPDGSLTSNE